MFIFSGFNFKSTADISIVIIVNKENPTSDLTVSQAKLYWLRRTKKRWPEINKNIRPVDRKKDCPEQQIFYKKVIAMKALDIDNYFLQRQYESSESPQEKFANDNAILEYVAAQDGAIGYINSATDISKFNVKIVARIE